MSDPLILPAFGIGPCEPATPPAATVPEPIEHDGWYPATDLAQLRLQARIRESVTQDRLREALLAALVWVGDQLSTWQAAQIAAGRTSLAAVPSVAIMNESRKLILYRHAVAAWTKALVVERYRDIDITSAGDRRAEDLDPSIGELKRDAIHAVRAILDQTRTSVELI